MCALCLKLYLCMCRTSLGQSEAAINPVTRSLHCLPQEDGGLRIGLHVNGNDSEAVYEVWLDDNEYGLVRRLVDFSIPRLTGIGHVLSEDNVVDPQSTSGPTKYAWSSSLSS